MNDLKSRFRWPVAVERPIAVPARRLWEVISMPGNLEPCHPFCAGNPVHAWPGEASHDEVHYLNGLVLERRFRRWIEGVGYDLEIGRAGGRTSFVSWRIAPLTPSASTLRIEVRAHVLQRVPVVLRWLPHMLRLRPGLASYLDSVIRGFEWHVTRGEPVPRNRFGAHPWFSARDRSAKAESR